MSEVRIDASDFDREHGGCVRFSAGRAGGEGADAFVFTQVYVFTGGDGPPRVIFRSGVDLYTPATVRSAAAVALAAADWIDEHVGAVVQR